MKGSTLPPRVQAGGPTDTRNLKIQDGRVPNKCSNCCLTDYKNSKKLVWIQFPVDWTHCQIQLLTRQRDQRDQQDNITKKQVCWNYLTVTNLTINAYPPSPARSPKIPRIKSQIQSSNLQWMVTNNLKNGHYRGQSLSIPKMVNQYQYDFCTAHHPQDGHYSPQASNPPSPGWSTRLRVWL